ncbi:lysosomal cobalamin transport escort protein LMBD1 isoform X1 [Petromyzon marinus]|uniref:lysosomal cobalamin transport escort protein LMBD1 isoform X1 n=1 Tax=Petromyzon marinus TaxID=7757 RepID=UPI003F70A41E
MAPTAGALSGTLLGWLIFAIVLLAILAFAWFYVRCYQSRHDSEASSTVTAILAVAIALSAAALLVVDIFLVSFAKLPNGTYKEWAMDNATRMHVENTVLYGYYTLYSLVLLFVFFWIPFVYFYYEEKGLEEFDSTRSRLCTAFKYTIGFVVVCGVLLLIGAFVPLEPPTDTNSTEWEKLEYLFQELGSGHGVDALAFSISTLTLAGMLCLIIYTAYGMSALPVNLIKGKKNAGYELLQNADVIDEVEQQIESIRAKCANGRPLATRDRRALLTLEERLRDLRRHERRLDSAATGCCAKVGCALRPLQIVLGVALSLVALLIIVTLFLSSLDRAMHSLGFSTGFLLLNVTLPNPINLALVYLQPVFPLDYILMAIITMYFVVTSMAGIRNMGIWFFWMKLYNIRTGRTRPQALLFLCLILMLIVMHVNYVIYSLAPDYVMYGNQKYLANKTTLDPSTKVGNTTWILMPCDAKAPIDDCTVTRMYLFLHKFWFFSSVYYIGNWAFMVVFVLGTVVSCFRGRRSSVDADTDAYLSEDSEDELVRV